MYTNLNLYVLFPIRYFKERHYIAEIQLKRTLSINQSINQSIKFFIMRNIAN